MARRGWWIVVLYCSVLMVTAMGVQAQTPVEFMLFLDFDSLTLSIPDTDAPVSLQDFAFETVIQRQRTTFRLDEFETFAALRFNALPTPLCLRLENARADSPLPLNCPPTRTITQRLSNADVFWYDVSARNTRTVLIVGGVEDIFCAAGQVSCRLEYAPSMTPTPLLTLTPALTATANSTPPPSTAAPMDDSTPRATILIPANIRTGDSTAYPIVIRLNQGQTVRILGISGRQTGWYQIQLPDGRAGWIAPSLVTVAGDLTDLPFVYAPRL